MTTASRIGRVTRGISPHFARAGQLLGRMGLSVPAGTLDPNASSAVRIRVTGWQVRNDGNLTGTVGGHIIIQRRGGLLNTQEISIIEGDWVENASPPQARLRVRELNEPLSATNVRRAVRWEPVTVAVQPGIVKNLAFEIIVGMDLIAGDKDLDIVAIVDKLPEGDGIAERRSANAFSVGDSAPPAPLNFNPVVLNQPQFDVFPQ